MERNAKVELAVRKALASIDGFINGAKVRLPSADNRRVCEAQLVKSASVRTATLFLAFYGTEDVHWDFDAIPQGYRGQHGDKLLAEQLTQRHLTLHNAITAFGENVGWKGNVKNVRLANDPKFALFCASLSSADRAERLAMADYIAFKFAESRRETQPLPPVGTDVLTFARARALFESLVALRTEGHVQQFLVAAMLSIHRRRFGMDVRTHHPHAADVYDRTAGDIEEFLDGRLIRAYEVTMRSDWKNRMSGFRTKMDRYGLSKYVIVAGSVNTDQELVEPAKLIAFLSPVGRDIAVIDIRDLTNVMAAELTASELREVVNLTYDFLTRKDLCGRIEFQDAYRAAVDTWLDGAS